MAMVMVMIVIMMGMTIGDYDGDYVCDADKIIINSAQITLYCVDYCIPYDQKSDAFIISVTQLKDRRTQLQPYY